MATDNPYADNPYADNPYAEQTAKNTSAGRLDRGPMVDVDLDGLRAYAAALAGRQADIGSRGAYLQALTETPGRAFRGEVLGEADAVRARLVANAGELNVYLRKLAESVGNIGNAARTIADSYRTGDALGAASLDDVLFAYGNTSVPRPEGLPDGVGATFRDQQAALAALPPAADTTTIFGRDGDTVSSVTTRTPIRVTGDAEVAVPESFGADG